MTWCDHCRNHYPIDHYPNGEHGIGPKFGVVGMELQAVDIVRNLAAHDAPIDKSSKNYYCMLCLRHTTDDHSPGCPWHQAKEWREAWENL